MEKIQSQSPLCIDNYLTHPLHKKYSTPPKTVIESVLLCRTHLINFFFFLTIVLVYDQNK